jgi:hypothetical protein
LERNSPLSNQSAQNNIDGHLVNGSLPASLMQPDLRARPAMSLEQGIQRLEELENCGLEVDAPDVGNLLGGNQSEPNQGFCFV